MQTDYYSLSIALGPFAQRKELHATLTYLVLLGERSGFSAIHVPGKPIYLLPIGTHRTKVTPGEHAKFQPS